jgi:hypothetical protein
LTKKENAKKERKGRYTLTTLTNEEIACGLDYIGVHNIYIERVKIAYS